MAGRVVTVTALGDFKDLVASMERAGLAGEEMSEKIAKSASAAGKAAAEQARIVGASADEQEGAAARAAAAFVTSSAEMSRAQRAAGDAAAEAARRIGLGLDEQKAAFARAVGVQEEFEVSSRRVADVSEETGAKLGLAFEAGTARAGSALSRLGKAGASWGIPFAGSIERIGTEFDNATTKSGKLMAVLEGAGKLTVGAGIAGFAAAAYEGVKGASELQSSMERLHTQAGASQGAVKGLTGQVLDMAGKVGVAPDQLSQGLYHVVSSLNATLPAATRTATEMNVLKIAAEGARVGNANLVDVTNALDAAVVSGIHGVKNYGSAMGALNATVGAGDMTMQDLADAFGTGVVVQAANAGVSITQLGGALATLGDNNIRGAKAGTLMASALRIMKAPSEAATTALNSINLSSTSLASALRSGGVVGALTLLKQHLADSGAAVNGTAAEMDRAGLIMTRAFGGRQSAGLQDLMGQLDRLKAKTADAGDGASKFGADWQATQQTLKQEMAQLGATVSALADKFGLYLIPKLEATGQAVASVVSWFEKHDSAAKAMAAIIEGVLSAAVATFALNKAAAFVGAVKNMGGALVGFAKTVASGVVGIATKLGLIGSSAETAEGEFATAQTGMVTSAEGAETGIVAANEGIVGSADATAAGVDTAFASTGIGAVLVALSIAAVELGTHWSTVMSGMKDAVNVMVTAAEKALNGLIGIMNDAIGAFDKTIGHLTGDIGRIGAVSTSGAFKSKAGYDVKYGKYGAYDAAPSDPGGRNSGQYAPHGVLPATRAPAIAAPSMTSGSTVSTGDAAQFSAALLQRLHIKWSQADMSALTGWISREGNDPSDDHNNPLDVTAYGGTPTNSVGVRTFSSANTGLNATTKFLHQSNFSAILASLKAGHGLSGSGVAGELSSWSGGGYSAVPSDPVNPKLSATLKKYLAGGGGTDGSADHYTKMAAATSTIPVAVVAQLKAAEALMGTPYVHGGGHGGWDPVAELKKVGLDCSGFVSRVLHAGGVQLPGPLNTTGLAQNLKKGAGQYETVYDRVGGSQAHTFMEIMGKWFMEGGNPAVNPKQQAVQLTAAQAKQEMSGGGFVAYHPVLPGGKNATDAQLEGVGVNATGASSSYTGVSVAAAAAKLAEERAKIRHALDVLLPEEGHRSAGNITVDAGRISSTVGEARSAGDTALTSAYGQDAGRLQARSKDLLASLNSELGKHDLKAATTTAATLVALSKAAGGTLTSVNKAFTTYLAGLSASGTTLLGSLQNAAQSGSVGSLESSLGVSTSNDSTRISNIISRISPTATSQQITGALSSTIDHNAISPTDYKAILAETRMSRHASLTAIDSSGASSAMKALERRQLDQRDDKWTGEARGAKDGTTTSGQRSFTSLIASLKSSGQTGLTQLADRLVAAHKAAIAALSLEMYAAQKNADADQMTLATTELKDRTTQATDLATSLVNIAKAQEQQVSDASSAMVQNMKDQSQIVSDQSTAQTQYVRDMTQTASDQFTAMATAIKDQSTLASDASNAQVNQINDSATTQSDTLGERGLYGLNLVAQQLKVQADIDKQGFDAQIDAAQQQLDVLQAQADTAESALQINLDQVTTQEDQLVSLAQAHLDLVTMQQDSNVAKAQAHLDTVTVQQDQKIASAQAHVDSVTMSQDIKTQLAQTAVDLSANAPKAQQDAAAATLKSVTAAAGLAEGKAAAIQSGVTDAANAAIQGASASYVAAQNSATAAIQSATDAYTSAQSTQAATVQTATSVLAGVTATYNAAIAAASAGVASATSAAGVGEAGDTGAVTVATAAASTQYAGTGTVINIEGVNVTDAAAIASSVGWALRTQTPF
jgi:hypothetical protein